jgi:hypothetical protein
MLKSFGHGSTMADEGDATLLQSSCKRISPIQQYSTTAQANSHQARTALPIVWLSC